MKQNPTLTIGPLLDQKGLAACLGLSEGTIERWRLLRQGPPYIKLGSSGKGGSIRYSQDAVAQWLVTHSVEAPADPKTVQL